MRKMQGDILDTIIPCISTSKVTGKVPLPPSQRRRSSPNDPGDMRALFTGR